WVQFHAATQNPPGLVTMIPHHGPINAYKYSMRGGGALHLGLLRWVVQQAISSQEAQKNPAAAAAVRSMLSGKSFLEWGARIPWQRGKTPLAKFPAYEDGAFQLYFENNDYTDFWRQPGFGMDEYFDSFPKMPILWVTSWFDWYPRTISDGYQKMVKMGRKNQYVIIGPWTHNNFRHTVGDVNFGNAAGRIGSYDDFLQLELAWFNRWMKGDKRADIGERVKVFVMGGGNGKRGAGGRLNHGGRWHYGDAWPPKEIRSIPFYLRGGGVLSQEKPTQEQSSTTYSYDPRNTVSSNGRCIIAYGPAAGKGFGGMGPRDQIELEALPGHGTPGKPIADRRDVLVYQTAPLTKDLRIMGNIKVTLWVSSDAPDTDFFVKLIDRYPPGKDYPQGYSFPVSEGILRARYRDSFEKPTPMKPGHVYRLIFPLEPAANLFRAGHRIRIYICSSNFPNFDINPNTGDPNDRRPRIAKNTVYHQAAHASLIELPVDRSPNAAFTADRTNGKPPLSVNFDASASSDRGGSIANYSWDFGDGEKAEGVRASHTYNRTGYFTVTLKVSNAEGFAATTRKTISVFRQHVGKWTVKNLDPGIGGKVEPTDDGGFVIRHPGETKNVNSVVNAIFIFQQLSGDMGVQARVARKGEGRWARSGVVIRESLKPKCRLAGMFVASPGRKAGWGDPVFNFYRQLRIGDFRGYCTSGNEAPRFPDKAWVRLERRGNTLIGSWSKDGGKWTELHRVSFDPPLRERLFVGIAADISAEVRDVKLLTTAEAKPSGRNGLRRKPSHK
ncbi:MAG: CocE/NonD family hydrolase, partial [Phycisphaerae bacterium]|nr:CocE/NonD family hydrolase [Phycisphaerae bacterium]